MDDLNAVAQEIQELLLRRAKGFPCRSATLVGILAALIVHEAQGDQWAREKLCEAVSGELFKAVEKANSKTIYPNTN